MKPLTKAQLKAKAAAATLRKYLRAAAEAQEKARMVHEAALADAAELEASLHAANDDDPTTGWADAEEEFVRSLLSPAPRLSWWQRIWAWIKRSY